MRSPLKVCSSGSSHTAHSLPTKVRSRRVRLLSALVAMTLLSILPTRRELVLIPDLTEPAEEAEPCPRRDLALIECPKARSVTHGIIELKIALTGSSLIQPRNPKWLPCDFQASL